MLGRRILEVGRHIVGYRSRRHISILNGNCGLQRSLGADKRRIRRNHRFSGKGTPSSRRLPSLFTLFFVYSRSLHHLRLILAFIMTIRIAVLAHGGRRSLLCVRIVRHGRRRCCCFWCSSACSKHRIQRRLLVGRRLRRTGYVGERRWNGNALHKVDHLLARHAQFTTHDTALARRVVPVRAVRARPAKRHDA